MKWTKEQIAIMRRNQAIQGRNRAMLAMQEMLGIAYVEMGLEEVPEGALAAYWEKQGGES